MLKKRNVFKNVTRNNFIEEEKFSVLIKVKEMLMKVEYLAN